MRRFLIALVLAVALVAFGVSQTNACWNCNTYEGDEYTYEGDTYNEGGEGGTGIGIGVGIGLGGQGGEGGNATIEEGAVQVDNTNVNVNKNVNVQGQQQGQIQGQMQGQSMGSQKNKQKTVITIEDEIQHVPIGSPIRTPDPLAAPTTELANDVWRIPDSVTMTEAKKITRHFPSNEHWIKNMLFIKGKKATRVLTKTKVGETRELMGYLHMKGNTGWLGIEVEHMLYQAAMRAGGTHFVVVSNGMQKKSGHIGGTFGLLASGGVTGSTQVGGSVGPTISGGRSGQKGKPFMTIAVYR